jgi:methylenetetrahydrofolate dehydrogenase (NADP+) / methenyltetrahydrofolate cyclohydrolase
MIIDGTALAQDIVEEIKTEVTHYVEAGRKPCLAVVVVGEDPASKIYVRLKTRRCEYAGIESRDIPLPATTTEEELVKTVENLNGDATVDGILVQLPLPKHISEKLIIETISPDKDVDGFHPINSGKLLLGDNSGFLPCTPHGIHHMLIRSDIDIEGKHVVIVGRSNIVGKPMAAILMQKAPHCNATVTIAHSRTQNLAEVCRSGDILIAAIGKANFITADMVKDGAVVIDVGINRVEDATAKKGYRIVGDVDFDNVKDKASHISPVPRGVGPMTIAMLLQNTLMSYKRREGL